MNTTLERAYEVNEEVNNELINFNERIRKNEVSEIVAGLKELCIDRFTVSTEQPDLLEILSIFEQNGCKVQGMRTVKSEFDFMADKAFEVPAIEFKLNK